MRDFRDEYISILREQVEQEINFLTRHGHDTDDITNPCIFCNARRSGFVCYRLSELKRFLSNIQQHEITRSRAIGNVPKERRKIGFDAVNSNEPLSHQGRMLTTKEVIHAAMRHLEDSQDPFPKIFG